MKYEVKATLENGCVTSFITKDYVEYNPERKLINGLYQIGFIKEGKTRKTWLPYENGKYGHNVKEIVISEATTGRMIEKIIATH